MRREAQEKIYQTELDLKKARLEYETLEFEINNGVVYSKIDGVGENDPQPGSGARGAAPARCSFPAAADTMSPAR